VILSSLNDLDPLAAALADRACARGAYLIWRAQARRISRVLVKSGRVEDVATSSGSGHGIQIVTGDARTALASRDDFRPEEALALLDHAVDAATAASALASAPRRSRRWRRPGPARCRKGSTRSSGSTCPPRPPA